ncbi:MAG: hypothetical protein GXP41_10625, partial [Chloroflexi bacterium]|nr:hypothetical protein [Chloroflexota bacterium]
ETYDSELFFLLNRRYHYPPDQIHVDLIRRAPRQDVPIDYDPLAADPDYLVVGPFSRGWHLYDPVLEAGAFRLIRNYGRYKIYERVRGDSSAMFTGPICDSVSLSVAKGYQLSKSWQPFV